MRSGAISASSSNSLLISETGVDIFASGDLDDYFTFSVTSDRPLFSATGNYLVLGKDATTGHSLDADDVLFGEDVEIDGVLYMDGDISLGANKLKTTNNIFKEETTNWFAIRNAADDAYINLKVSYLRWGYDGGTLQPGENGVAIATPGTDNNYILINAQDNTVGLVEVMRWVGAADPYIRIGRDDTGVSLNTVTDMLVLQAGAGTNNEAANFGLGISVLLGNAASQVEERASIDFVLTTATDGSEDTRMDFNVMVGGSMAKSLSIKDTGIAIVEKAAASPDIAGEGQLWVKSDTPNTPWFTDDAGNDTPLIGNVHPLVNTYISGTGTAGTDNTAETVKTVVVPANTLTQVGDRLRVRVYFRGDTGGGITMTNTVNTVTVAAATDGGGTDWFMTETWLHYIGVNNANIAEMGATPATGSNTAANVGGFDWSAAQDVDCDQNQVSANHIVVYAIFLDVYPKGVI